MSQRHDGAESGLDLFTDLYELTMVQAYFQEGINETAVFDLFARRLPARRNFLLAAGLDDFLTYLEDLRFTAESLDYLKSLRRFSPAFLDYLRDFRFDGDVYAVAEGTPVFAQEPIVEVVAPMIQGQLVETFALNQIHFQTVAASKAVRVIAAARGRPVSDFGMRRIHGIDAAVKAAKAFYIAGIASTSNVLAGRLYGIPTTGTMAHSYIEAHRNEMEAFKAYNHLYPGTVLLVDTYDTVAATRKVVRLARELGDDFRAVAIRLDSGDLPGLAGTCRKILDEAGLKRVAIFASGGLDEFAIADLIEGGAPIDGFGVGTKMAVSNDAPHFDCSYKLVEYAGQGCMKLSSRKVSLPGRKQIRRITESGRAVRDVISLHGEPGEGRELLEKVMASGRRLPAGRRSVEESRVHARTALAELPPPLCDLEPCQPYPIGLSSGLEEKRRQVRERLSRRELTEVQSTQ